MNVNVPPLKFRPHASGEGLLFANDMGMFFKSDDAFLGRYAAGNMTTDDTGFLLDNGFAFEQEGDLDHAAMMFRQANRLARPGSLDYLILVPTLRCDLACGYCQVSRVNEGTPGFDWSDDTLEAVLAYIDTLDRKHIKIEFQGGEPTLRMDILNRVRDHCRTRFAHSEFVVCTNLQKVGAEAWSFFEAPDTFVSTSLDGDLETHARQRTKSHESASAFADNLKRAVVAFPGRVSALPTLDVLHLPAPETVIETFTSVGLRSIFLRPVNHQGFARKRFSAIDVVETWNRYHSIFIDAMIDHNARAELPIEEYYLTHCLRRIMRPGQDGHTDLRNPALLGKSFIVIDHDGAFYPTDEARMLTRIGAVDLSCGHVRSGLDMGKLDLLNRHAFNQFDPDCVHCPHQAFCGVDVIDDLARYGRIDMPRHATDFCRRHTYLFDKAFELLYSDDPKVQRSLAIWLGVRDYDPAVARRHS